MLFQKQFLPVHENKLEEYCGLLSNLQLTTLTYGVRPLPYVGSIDLAAAFFSTDKLAREKIFFGTAHVYMLYSHSLNECYVVLCHLQYKYRDCVIVLFSKSHSDIMTPRRILILLSQT